MSTGSTEITLIGLAVLGGLACLSETCRLLLLLPFGRRPLIAGGAVWKEVLLIEPWSSEDDAKRRLASEATRWTNRIDQHSWFARLDHARLRRLVAQAEIDVSATKKGNSPQILPTWAHVLGVGLGADRTSVAQAYRRRRQPYLGVLRGDNDPVSMEALIRLNKAWDEARASFGIGSD